ncbi:hypothetical protein FB567DRAFT_514396 [Paraphoma chrysanthemicola]|uniref:SET domain-containing protein n=1 Tax=Paraphoma chrysanthemicola TaxID=798071 RepID=A0A8K0RHK2_9PLEO|nr:hypothetical protein FB567DRAFT_514396 [Paraphoma chrysanthemicola]
MSSETHPPADAVSASNPIARAAELSRWFTQGGGHISSDADIAYSDSRGFHLRATRPLSSPVVVTCPLQLTLSCLNLDPDHQQVLHIDSLLQQCRQKIPDHVLTYLLLIEQRKKGTASPWHAYLAALPGPDSMTTPLWFDEDDMAFLAGTGLMPAIKERKAEYQQQWQNAVKVLSEIDAAQSADIDFQSFLWAATICTSRAFISTHILPDRETFPILFPVVDILNHSAEAQVEWAFETNQSFSLKLLNGETFIPGQELFNNYAPKQNDELLLGYGFCLENHAIEQFSLKLAFPPAMRQYAQQMRLFEPVNVPFGMNTDFLTADADNESHSLRAPGHPFGRYQNRIPFFRGIPPYIVHFFFIQTLLSLDIDIQDLNAERPGGRITLQVLIFLHQAISQRCQTLPLNLPHQPANIKQTFAKIYRDGQAKIIHSIRIDLEAAINRLRSPADQIPPSRAALIPPSQALLALAADSSPRETSRFQSGLAKHNLSSPTHDTLIWTLLLTCLAAYHLTRADDTASLTTAWLRTLYTRHPLPLLEDGIEDADTYTFVDENLTDFVVLPAHETEVDLTAYLDGVGENFSVRRHGDASSDGPALVKGPTENLGVRIIMWAMRVVEAECVDAGMGSGEGKGLYVVPWRQGEEDEGEEWMYEDVV